MNTVFTGSVWNPVCVWLRYVFVTFVFGTYICQITTRNSCLLTIFDKAVGNNFTYRYNMIDSDLVEVYEERLGCLKCNKSHLKNNVNKELNVVIGKQH